MRDLGLNAELAKQKPDLDEIQDLVDQIQSAFDVMRTMNNKYMTKRYRIDVKEAVVNDETVAAAITGQPVASSSNDPGPKAKAGKKKIAAAGVHIGYYKIDVQTVTQQKKLSETVAIVFLNGGVKEDPVEDLKAALVQSATDHHMYATP